MPWDLLGKRSSESPGRFGGNIKKAEKGLSIFHNPPHPTFSLNSGIPDSSFCFQNEANCRISGELLEQVKLEEFCSFIFCSQFYPEQCVFVDGSHVFQFMSFLPSISATYWIDELSQSLFLIGLYIWFEEGPFVYCFTNMQECKCTFFRHNAQKEPWWSCL